MREKFRSVPHDIFGEFVVPEGTQMKGGREMTDEQINRALGVKNTGKVDISAPIKPSGSIFGHSTKSCTKGFGQ